MDDDSLWYFATSMGIRCVPVAHLGSFKRTQLWKLRVDVKSCLGRKKLKLGELVNDACVRCLCSEV